jgi:thioredoxin 1
VTMSTEYLPLEPARTEIDALTGAAVVEFGAPWCPICRGAEPLIAEALGAHTDVRHFKVEDGPGRPLGRSFRVKLWPTLIFLRDGQEIARVVRPTSTQDITAVLDRIDPQAARGGA